jgi:hypothetical protein
MCEHKWWVGGHMNTWTWQNIECHWTSYQSIIIDGNKQAHINNSTIICKFFIPQIEENMCG